MAIDPSGSSEAAEPLTSQAVRPGGRGETRLRLDWNAVLALVAALLGAGIGAVVTVIVTGRQINASDRAALRERRQVAYAELILSADEYLSALDGYADIALQPLPEDAAQLERAQATFRQDLTLVVLLGSHEVRLEAIALQDELSELHTDVVRVYEGESQRKPHICHRRRRTTASSPA